MLLQSGGMQPAEVPLCITLTLQISMQPVFYSSPTSHLKEQVERLYAQMGAKWTEMAQKLGITAEHCRSILRHDQEKKTFGTHKWWEWMAKLIESYGHIDFFSRGLDKIDFWTMSSTATVKDAVLWVVS